MVKDLNNEGLIESFWITNGTIKIRESSQSKPISITHESDLHLWGIKKLDINMVNLDFAFNTLTANYEYSHRSSISEVIDSERCAYLNA